MHHWRGVVVILSLIAALQALKCDDLLPGQYYCANARYSQALCDVENKPTGEDFIKQQQNVFPYSRMRDSVRYRVRRRRQWYISKASRLHKQAKRHELAHGAHAVGLSWLGGHRSFLSRLRGHWYANNSGIMQNSFLQAC